MGHILNVNSSTLVVFVRILQESLFLVEFYPKVCRRVIDKILIEEPFTVTYTLLGECSRKESMLEKIVPITIAKLASNCY